MRRSSSFSASKYKVVTSHRHSGTSPLAAAWAKHASATTSKPNQSFTLDNTVPQHGAPPASDQARSLGRSLRLLQAHPVKVEHVLTRSKPPASLGHEHRESGLTVRGTDRLQDDIAPGSPLRDLHLRAARAARGTMHEHHNTDPTEQRSVSIS